MKIFTLALALLCVLHLGMYAQQTVGLFQYNQEKSFNGLTLFCPVSSTTTYLMDNCGRIVHNWKSSYTTGHAVYLLEDGSILRAGNIKNPIFVTGGGGGGMIERIGWDGTMLWAYTMSNDTLCQHHDIRMLPNGNVLMVVWDRKTKEQVKAAGRTATTISGDMWAEKIIEVKPTGPTTGDIVWQWSLWDHLVQEADSTLANYGKVSEHPELVNINFSNVLIPDWVHFNAVDYNAELDQIVISVHSAHEIWIIDHSTTTAQAALHSGGRSGKGGDLLFRWGNPAVYNAGTAADERMPGGQHHVHWIPKGLTDGGNIMLFNNRVGGGVNNGVSSVDIIAPVVDEQGNYARKGATFAPDSAYWRYMANPPTSFFGANLSGMQRLPNGNTLICMGPRGTFFEIDPSKETVWRYVSPVSQGKIANQGDSIANNNVFRCLRYGYDYPAFKGRTLVSGEPLEQNPLPSSCSLPTAVEDEVVLNSNLLLTPNPSSGLSTASFRLDKAQNVSLVVFDLLGKKLATLAEGELAAGTHSYAVSSAGNTGLVFVRLVSAGGVQTLPLRFSGE